MKKLFTIAALVIAAMTVNAEITEMTCAEAAAAAALLEHNTPGTDSVAVTGYVTSTDGNISRGQQTFWLDDQKGSVKTFEGYWCNLPEEALNANPQQPLNVGDKVRIVGFLMRYNSTYEMKNGEVIILERAVVQIDTIEATVCEAIEECEALESGDNTSDVFQVIGIVSSLGSTNDNYHTQTFYMECEDNEKTLQAYNITMEGDYANLGDTVFCQGRLVKFNETLEITGDAMVIGAAGFVADTIEATVAEAIAAAMALENGKTTVDIYVVTGYVDSIAFEFKNGSMSFFMTDNMDSLTYDFEAYNVKCSEEVAAKVLVGAKVKVTAALQHYYKAATEEKPEVNLAETVKGGEVEVLEEVLAVENVTSDALATKRLENGQLIIYRNGARYTVTGVNVQ